ncbi:MAG TPA: GPR1/FUN34/YaaH family transporter [Stellaceae bacterium]|nr:GPR1/FUN34/YaaH family transporter [Stellaceae bacterium]
MDRVRDRQERATWTTAGPVITRMPDDEVLALEERAMASTGDSSPLGLWAFATGTWILGTVIGGAFGAPFGGASGATAASPPVAAAAVAAVHAATVPAATHLAPIPAGVTDFVAVVPILLIFGGVAQFIAGLFSYRRASSLLATAFTCYGAFAVLAATAFLLMSGGALPITGGSLVIWGFLLESFAFISFALCLAAIGTNLALVLMLGLVTIGFVLAGLPNLAQMTTGGWVIIGNIGGWFMVASAACAAYLGMAILVNSSWKRSAIGFGGGRPC